jgi:hypothetical protein
MLRALRSEESIGGIGALKLAAKRSCDTDSAVNGDFDKIAVTRPSPPRGDDSKLQSAHLTMVRQSGGCRTPP